jgi:hypothetical protein
MSWVDILSLNRLLAMAAPLLQEVGRLYSAQTIDKSDTVFYHR